MVLAIITIPLLAGVILAVELLYLAKSRPSFSNDAELRRRLSLTRNHERIERLLRRTEEASGTGRQRTPHFHRRRRRLLISYLCRLRLDFHSLWSLCCYLAPISADPEFGVMLVRRLLQFYGLYLLIWMKFFLGLHGRVIMDAQFAARRLRGLHDTALQLLQTVDVTVA